nr:Mor transcription activator family protein [Pseudanabaena sp. FACHB-1998]
MVKILGREASSKLVELCGGNQLEIPSCRFLNLELRNQKIRDDRQSLSIEKLAAKYALCRQQIRKICKG